MTDVSICIITQLRVQSNKPTTNKMAALVSNLKKTLTFSRIAHLKRAALNTSRSYANEISIESRNDDDREPKVGISIDGKTLICWHPEPIHPYEHTQPLTYDNLEAGEGDVPIQKRLLKRYETRFRPEGPTDQELSRMTYTTKHRWFPNSKKKYAVPNVEVEREGL